MLLGLAASSTASLLLLPQGPWLAPTLAPLTTALSAGWLTWRAVTWLGTFQTRRGWLHTPDWELAPEALPPPDTGVYLGEAFAWDATHTQVLAMALAVDGRLPVGQGRRGGYPMLHAVGKRQEQALTIPWSELEAHTQITGTTGAGKTRLFEVMTAQAIHAPGATVVLDPKGDRDWLARCAAEAHKAGKPFAVITPAFPQHSHRMNVLDTCTTATEVTARLSGLMPQSKEPVFRNYPLALLRRIATAQATLGQAWTLEGLYRPATLSHDLEALTLAYLVHLGYAPDLKRAKGDYRKANTPDLIADELLEDLAHERDHFRALTTNIVPTFDGIVGEPYGPLFSARPADVTWHRIADESMVVYVALASLLLGDIAHKMGRLILQDLLGYLGWRQAYTDLHTATPITVFVDEVARVAYPHFPTALAMSRSAKVRFVVAQQSMSDIEATLETKALARQVQDNCNTRLWFRMTDESQSPMAEQGAPTCTVQLPAPPRVGIGYGGVGGLSGSTSQGLVPQEVPLIHPSWFTALPRGEAYVHCQGQWSKLRVPRLPPVTQAELDTLGLTALWHSLPPNQTQILERSATAGVGVEP
jgi:conjugal transfer pilus assembly protein TraD